MNTSFIFAIDVSFIANKDFIQDVLAALKYILPLYIYDINILVVLYSKKLKTFKLSTLEDMKLFNTVKLSIKTSDRLFTNIKNSRCITFTNFIKNNDLSKIGKNDIVVYSDDYSSVPDHKNIRVYKNYESIIESIGELFTINNGTEYFLIGKSLHNKTLSYTQSIELCCALDYEFNSLDKIKTYITIDDVQFLHRFVKVIKKIDQNISDNDLIDKVKKIIERYSPVICGFIKYLYHIILDNACFDHELFKTKLIDYLKNKNTHIGIEHYYIDNIKDHVIFLYNKYIGTDFDVLKKIEIVLDLRKFISHNIKLKNIDDIVSILNNKNDELWETIKYVFTVNNIDIYELIEKKFNYGVNCDFNILVSILYGCFITEQSIYMDLNTKIDEITTMYSVPLTDNIESINNVKK